MGWILAVIFYIILEKLRKLPGRPRGGPHVGDLIFIPASHPLRVFLLLWRGLENRALRLQSEFDGIGQIVNGLARQIGSLHQLLVIRGSEIRASVGRLIGGASENLNGRFEILGRLGAPTFREEAGELFVFSLLLSKRRANGRGFLIGIVIL